MHFHSVARYCRSCELSIIQQNEGLTKRLKSYCSSRPSAQALRCLNNATACKTSVKVMDKVNCELYRFTVELKLRAMICPSTQANGRQPPAFDGQATNAVRSGAGTCSRSTSSTSGSVVKDVKGTGDPEGIIDAVGRRPIGMAAAAIGEEVVCLSSTRRLACTQRAVCYTCTGELDTPFSLV